MIDRRYKWHAMDPEPRFWKDVAAGAVVVSTLLLLIVALNLPYRYVEREGSWHGTTQFVEGDSQGWSDGLPIMAGWPLRYWVRYETGGRHEDRYWEPSKLAINVVGGLAIAAAVFGFTLVRFRMIRSSRNPRLTRVVFDGLVAMMILAFPCSWCLVTYRTYRKDGQVLQQASRFGNCYTASWLPEPVADRLPMGVIRLLSRVREVKLIGPSDVVLESVAGLETVTSLYTFGGDFRSDALAGLVSNPHFTSLQITRRKLDSTMVDSIGRFKWVTELRLRGTDLDSESFRKLDQLERLRVVDLRETSVELQKLGTPSWSTHVRFLALPRPATGIAATLKIDGWPQLAKLLVARSSMRLNDAPLTLHLSRLPRLETIFLNRVQKHALIAHQLPRLTRIEEDTATLFVALGSSNHLPGHTWFSRLELDGVESLGRIGCYAGDLDSLQIRNAPSLRYLEIGAFDVYSSGTAKLISVDPHRCQQWIEGLGQGDGPALVDLTSLPLAGVRLEPLTENSRIRQLRLSHSGVTFDQVKCLASMPQLERLDLGACPLEHDQLAWLLERLPNLRRLRVNVSQLRSVELSKLESLRHFETTTFQDLRELQIVDSPNLIGQLHLLTAPDTLLVENAPALRGLAVAQPWPKQARISGCRDLEWFAAGGPEVDDEIVNALLGCSGMDRITLAHTRVSAEKFAELGRLDRLTSLVVPGAPIGDDVTRRWHGLKMLQEVDLSDTSISAATIAWLAKIETLRRLTLNRIEFNAEAALAMSNLIQLTDLDLADAVMDPKPLLMLLAEDSLERLDLSGWRIGDDLAAGLARNQSLKQLTLRRCQIDPGAVQRIAEQSPAMLMDLGVAKQPAGVRANSVHLWKKMMSTADFTFELIDGSADSIDDPANDRVRAVVEPGRIDPDRFRMPVR